MFEHALTSGVLLLMSSDLRATEGDMRETTVGLLDMKELDV